MDSITENVNYEISKIIDSKNMEIFFEYISTSNKISELISLLFNKYFEQPNNFTICSMLISILVFDIQQTGCFSLSDIKCTDSFQNVMTNIFNKFNGKFNELFNNYEKGYYLTSVNITKICLSENILNQLSNFLKIHKIYNLELSNIPKILNSINIIIKILPKTCITNLNISNNYLSKQSITLLTKILINSNVTSLNISDTGHINQFNLEKMKAFENLQKNFVLKNLTTSIFSSLLFGGTLMNYDLENDLKNYKNDLKNCMTYYENITYLNVGLVDKISWDIIVKWVLENNNNLKHLVINYPTQDNLKSIKEINKKNCLKTFDISNGGSCPSQLKKFILPFFKKNQVHLNIPESAFLKNQKIIQEESKTKFFDIIYSKRSTELKLDIIFENLMKENIYLLENNRINLNLIKTLEFFSLYPNSDFNIVKMASKFLEKKKIIDNESSKESFYLSLLNNCIYSNKLTIFRICMFPKPNLIPNSKNLLPPLPSITSLPIEIILYIFSFVDTKKYLNSIKFDDIQWTKKYYEHKNLIETGSIFEENEHNNLILINPNKKRKINI